MKTFLLHGPIEPEMADRLATFLNRYRTDVVELNINSPGGNVAAAAEMIILIVRHQLVLKATVTGRCSSTALWILCYVPHRIATAGSVFMHHHAVGGEDWQSVELRAKVTKEIEEDLTPRLNMPSWGALHMIPGDEIRWTAEDLKKNGFLKSVIPDAKAFAGVGW